MTVIAAIREYFLLSDARATAKVVPEDARVAIGRQLAVGRQRSEAADALWSNGHVAEGLRLASEALAATLDAVEPFDRAVGPGSANRGIAPSIPAKPIAAPAEPTESADGVEGGESRETSSDEPSADEPSADEPSAEATAADADVDAANEASDEESASDEAPAAETQDASAARYSVPEPPVTASTEPAWVASLRQRGLTDAKLRAVRDAERATRDKPLPLLDTEVSAAEGELFQQLVTARRHVDGVLSPASMTPGQLAFTRASRIGFAAFLGIAVLVGLFLLLKPPTGVEATGSGQFNAEFVPANVIDGDDATEWLLPDRQTGWVDVRIMPPERIETIRLKNSHNRHYNDRATNEYTIELFSNGQLVRTIEGSWQGINPRPDWTEHAAGVDDVERIRVNVRTWHRAGGGLAELDWD